jgi:hypothetical protein
MDGNFIPDHSLSRVYFLPILRGVPDNAGQIAFNAIIGYVAYGINTRTDGHTNIASLSGGPLDGVIIAPFEDVFRYVGIRLKDA